MIMRRRRGEGGSTYAQYVALGALAALILSGLVVAGIGPSIGDGVKAVICRIVTLGKGDCPAPGAEAPKPKLNFLPVYCDALVKSHNENLASNIWFIHFGANFSLMWEKLANGEVWITVVPYDYELGVQKKFNVGEKVKGSVGANVSLAFGQTYQFQSDDEAKGWEQTLRDNMEENNPASWRFWNPFDGNTKKTPDPAITSVDGGVNAGVEAGIKVPATKNLDLGASGKAQVSAHVIRESWHLWDPKRNRYWDNTSYTYKLSGEYNADLSAQYTDGDGTAGGHVGGGQKWTASIRYMYNPDGSLASIRWITTYKKQINGGVNVGPGENGKSGKEGSEQKPTTKKPPPRPNKGKRGKPKAKRLQGGKKGSKGRKNNRKKVQQNKNNKNQRRQARQKNTAPPAGKNGQDDTGGDPPTAGADVEKGKEVTRMTQLNFDDPKDPRFADDPAGRTEAERQQRVGHDYIHKYGVIPPIPIMNAITGKTNAVTDDPGPNADPMTRLMYDRGKAWEWNSDNTTITKNLIDSDPLEVSISDETKITKDAEYLDGPVDGHRDYKSFPACTAQKVPEKHDYRLDGY